MQRNPNLVVGPASLIRLAEDSIDQEAMTNELLTGRKAFLSTQQKGKIIVKFLQMKNQPLENRQFYEQFYEQQDKAEKINVLQDVSKRIHQVIAADEAQRSSE